MTTPRFLVPEPLRVGETIALPPACSHHAQRVLRLRIQDRLVLFDGRGNEFEAFLVPDPLGGARCCATITHGAAVDREARLRISVVQALSSQEKMDWFVEKAVELGARRILLTAAARSVVHLSGPRRQRRADRWREIAAAACSQCGRNELPLIEIFDDLGTALRAAQDASARWVLDPGARAGLGRTGGDSIACAVGPEGGFTAEELALAQALGYTGASLGKRVLRTETAALAAISALLALQGEFS
jgi:16S rRNA (uracil1498-N3)-methyltransferase